MVQTAIFGGKRYKAVAGSVNDATQKMIQLANEENVFVYEFINGTLLVIEPGMSVEDGVARLKDVRAGKLRVEYFDPVNDFSAADIATQVEKLAKENDFVISNINGTYFRATKNMVAKDILALVSQIRTQQFEKGNQKVQDKNNIQTKLSMEQAVGMALQQHQGELSKS